MYWLNKWELSCFHILSNGLKGNAGFFQVKKPWIFTRVPHLCAYTWTPPYLLLGSTCLCSWVDKTWWFAQWWGILQKSEGGREQGVCGNMLLRPWVDLRGIILIAEVASSEGDFVIFVGSPSSSWKFLILTNVWKPYLTDRIWEARVSS